MMKNKIKQLDKLYNEIAQAFCNKHKYDFEGWTGRPGSIFSAGDYFVDFHVALHDLETEQPEDMFIKWYDLSLYANSVNGNMINYAISPVQKPIDPKFLFAPSQF